MINRILSPKEVRQLQKRYQELQSEIAQVSQATFNTARQLHKRQTGHLRALSLQC
jgi:flagellin-like hook-associated protein FlgL